MKSLYSFMKYCLVVALIFTSSVVFADAMQLGSSLSSLEIRGIQSGENFSRPVICADLNGDGYEDIIVGADKYSFDVGQRPTLYLFQGSRDYRTRELIDLAQTGADAVILGDTGSTNLATSLAAGDVNHDGIADLIATDSSQDAKTRVGAGAAYILFGSADFFDTATYDLASGDWDLKILGAAAGDDLGGANLFGGLICDSAASGDLNGDTIDDIALGAHLADPAGRDAGGEIYIVFGSASFTSGTTIDLSTQADVTILAEKSDNELGTALTTGDYNGDGITDLIAGYPLGSSGSYFESEGRLYVFYGRSTFPSQIDMASTNASVQVLGDDQNDNLGDAVASGDLNGDGIDDLIGTAGGWNNDVGAVYGFFGSINPTSSISLSSQSPSFLVEGKDVQNDIGTTLVAGDFNGDGLDDIIFSSRDGERLNASAEGRTYLIYGRGTAFPSQFLLANDGVDVIINGGFEYFQLGDRLAKGDIDGDGADEILIAAPFYDSGTGRLLVFDLTPATEAPQRWEVYR